MAAIAFLAEENSLTWGTDKGISNGFPHKEKGNAVICTTAGLPVVALQIGGESWEGHTINGVATASYQGFQQALDASGWGV